MKPSLALLLMITLAALVITPAAAQAIGPPLHLRIAGQTSSEADFAPEKSCMPGSPTGAWKLDVSADDGKSGTDWEIVELVDLKTEERVETARVYRMSGPCWAPDGSYFVYGEGGIVKVAKPGSKPIVLWQPSDAPRGGIFPAQAYNFRWGTGMNSLTFLYIDDPRDKQKWKVKEITLLLRQS